MTKESQQSKHMQQHHKVKAQIRITKEIRPTEPSWNMTERMPAALHFFTCHRSGVDPRKMPVDPACGFPQTGGYELTSWSPLLQKNQRATRRTHEPQCKNKRSKIGVATPGALSTRCACPPRGGCLPGRPSQGSPAQCSKWHH